MLGQLRQEGGNVQDLEPGHARSVSLAAGAGRYILGTITAFGDRVQVSASLYDIRRGGEPLATAHQEQRVDSVSSLIIALTQELFAGQPVGAGPRLSSISTVRAANHIAERAYLEGVALDRRARFDSAAGAFTRAIEADSSFALAWYGLSEAGTMGGGTVLPWISIDAAMRHRGPLSHRDQLTIETAHAYLRGDGARAERLALELVGTYPDNLEGWSLLGSTRFLYAWQTGRSPAEGREPLERGLALDPDDRTSLHMLQNIALDERRYVAIESLAVKAYPTNGRLATNLIGALLTRAIGQGDSAAARRLIGDVKNQPDWGIWYIVQTVASYTDDLRWAREIAQLLTDSSRRSEGTRADGHLTLALIEVARGRWRGAAEEFSRAEAHNPALGLAYRAWISSAPGFATTDAYLRELRAELLRWRPDPQAVRGTQGLIMPTELHSHIRNYLLGLVSARLGDGNSALRYAAALENATVPEDARIFPSLDVGVDAQVLPDLALEVRALAALQRGDRQAALAALSRMNLRVLWHTHYAVPIYLRPIGRLLRAELLDSAGDRRGALGWYRGFPGASFIEFVFLGPVSYRQALIHERLGEPDKALEYYRRFLARWEDADPEYQSLVRTARERVMRLAANSKVVARTGNSAERAVAPALRRPVIAVLPVESNTLDRRDTYLAAGLHQEIITRLGILNGVEVLDRGTMLRYDTTTLSSRAVAAELGADYVLRGRLSKGPAGIAFNAGLLEASSGQTVWSQTFGPEPSVLSLLEVQLNVARGIAVELEIKLTSLERGRLAGRHTENAKAYDLYLEAIALAASVDRKGSIEAERLLKRALTLDPKFTAALTLLAHVYSSRSYLLGESRAWADSAGVYAHRAIQLDSSFAEANDALGLSYVDRGRLNQAANLYARTLALRPNDGPSLMVLGWVDFLKGRVSNAVPLWHDARAASPTEPVVLINLSLAHELFGDRARVNTLLAEAGRIDSSHPALQVTTIERLIRSGRMAEARAHADRFLERNPGSSFALDAASNVALRSGNYRLAKKRFEAYRRLGPDDWNYWGLTYRTSYAFVLQQLGEQQAAAQLLDQTLLDAHRLIDRGDERPGVRREIAAIHAARDERDRAFEWLARAIDAGWRLEALQPSPLFERLRGDDRFRRLMARVDEDIRKARSDVERSGLSKRLDRP